MRGKRIRAFTLIELLVVIAIIAILAAILFPVFAQAREKARTIQCLSNMNQIGRGVMMYLQDYDETYPAMWTQCPAPDNAANIDIRNRYFTARILPYIKNAQVFRCPSDPLGRSDCYPRGGASSFNEGGRSYSSVSSVLGATTDSPKAIWDPPNPNAATPRVGITLAEIDEAAETIMIAEKAQDNPDSNICWPNNVLSWRTVSTVNPSVDGGCVNGGNTRVGPRHQGGSNFIFADGHAKWSRLERTIFPKNLWWRKKDPNDSLFNTANFVTFGTCARP